MAFDGSSPRVWGEVPPMRPRHQQKRIIPTRVGRSGAHTRPAYKVTDHPHACGEKRALLIIYRLRIGSSPRVWGEDQHFVIVRGRYPKW